MSGKYFPRQDGLIAAWVQNFLGKLELDPQRYALSDDELTAYAQDVAAYLEARTVADAPDTRTRTSVLVRNRTRAEVERASRHLAQRVMSLSDLSDAERISLGLPARRQGRGTRSSAPTVAPSVTLGAVVGNVVSVQLRDGLLDGHRVRPRGILGAAIYTCLSEDIPVPGHPGWRLKTYTTVPRLTLTFDEPQVVAGSKVWVCAQWLDTRLRPGPLSNAISTHIQHRSILGAA